MRLTLSRHSPLDSVFTDENGQVRFKVESESPAKLSKRLTTIACVVPNLVPSKNGQDEDTMHDRFAHLAQIEFNVVSSSVIRYGGDELETKDYFRKEGWWAYGRHRTFTGPDGVEYKWLLGVWVPELIINDGLKTPVARYKRPTLGIIGKARPGSLEILPAGEHMVEMILITFIYIEKIRKDKERAAR